MKARQFLALCERWEISNFICLVHRKADDLLISRLDLGLGLQELSSSLLENEVGSDGAVEHEEHIHT